jgi:hypothetical protein
LATPTTYLGNGGDNVSWRRGSDWPEGEDGNDTVDGGAMTITLRRQGQRQFDRRRLRQPMAKTALTRRRRARRRCLHADDASDTILRLPTGGGQVLAMFHTAGG